MGSLGCVKQTICNLAGNANGIGNGLLVVLWFKVANDSFSDIGPTPVLPSVISIT